jgi:hypothetical protein
MTELEREAMSMMYKAIGAALIEIHNPGASRNVDFDIIAHLEAVRAHAVHIVPGLGMKPLARGVEPLAFLPRASQKDSTDGH